jgi:ankyrin repeat protein
VYERNYKAVEFFLSNGADINFNGHDQVFSCMSTPLCVAARNADLEMCKHLVEHGADVSICDKYGMRPYSIAVEKGNTEMAEYFKSLEPAEFHSLQNKLFELKSYKLPNSLLDFLQGQNLRLEFGKGFKFKFIEFFPLIDTVETKKGKQKLLRISKNIDNYGYFDIVWNPQKKCIAFNDIEHEELVNVAPFDEFIKDVGGYIQKMIDGDLDF